MWMGSTRFSMNQPMIGARPTMGQQQGQMGEPWLTPFNPQVMGGLRGMINQYADGKTTILTPKQVPVMEKYDSAWQPFEQVTPTTSPTTTPTSTCPTTTPTMTCPTVTPTMTPTIPTISPTPTESPTETPTESPVTCTPTITESPT
jgi:hypothetical protein